eukprot:SAG25_NODE_10713_length_324_cov_1.155556_1_plen_54_part_10
MGAGAKHTPLPTFMPLSDFFESEADPCSAQTFVQWQAEGRQVRAVSKWVLPGGQ